MSSAYEKQRKMYEALQRNVASLADTLEKAMPDLPEPSSVTRTRDGCITILTGRVSSPGCHRHTLHMHTRCMEAYSNSTLRAQQEDFSDSFMALMGCFHAHDLPA